MEINGLKDKFTEYFSSLSDREKRVVALGIPLLLVILFTFAVIVPLQSLKTGYERKRAFFEEKFEKLKPQVEELLCLKREFSPIEEKLKRGANLDVPSFIQTVARMVGLDVKNIKVQPGEEKYGYQKEIVTVTFKEADINRVARLISSLENGSYYFKADGITVTDYDENGLVSGKVTLFFYRRGSEG